jgi:hypothetical protein
MCVKDSKTGVYTELCYQCRQTNYEEDTPFGSVINIEYGYLDE